MSVRAGFVALCIIAAAAWPQVQSARAEEKANAQPGDVILGEWWTENNQGRVSMARYKDGTYRGTTTCCEHKDDKDNPNIDIHNPKPELRNRSTVGIVLIWNLKFEDGQYVDGRAYNPRDGKTYRMKMEVIDKDTLKIRGYMGIELLGQTQFWKRAHLSKK